MKREWLIFFCLFFLGHVFAAGIETIGVGTRATAMGGNYRAIADDWSAMYWNPAGLAFAPEWNAGLLVSYVAPRATFQAGPSHYYDLNGGADFKQFSAAYQLERPSEPQNLIVPAAGLSYCNGTWAFGLAVWAPMGWKAEWDVLKTASNNSGQAPGPLYDGYNDAYPTNEYESDIRIIDIHPTVSFKVNDKLALGLGASMVLGDIFIRQPAFLQNPYLYDQTLYRTLQSISDDGALYVLDEMRKPPFDHLITEAYMKSSGRTVGVNFGMQFKPAKAWSVGASLQYYADLKASGDYRQTTCFGDAPLYHQQAQVFADALFRKLYDAGLLDAEHFRIVSELYSGNTFPRIDTRATVTIPLPLKAGFGVCYNGLQNIVLAFDGSYTQWSVWDVIDIIDQDGAAVSRLVQNWNDTFQVGLGVEYSSRIATLRCGFGYDGRAAVDEAISPTIPDIGDRYHLSLGIAVPLGSMALAVNYEHIFIADREITGWVYDDMMVTQNIAGLYTMGANSVMIGVDYSFMTGNE
ncbi:outer membrane protein transport protein [candidate division KSB1 bacterium]|nr:outer membrane protein transport protein [candidate division KSB1 bacterium]